MVTLRLVFPSARDGFYILVNQTEGLSGPYNVSENSTRGHSGFFSFSLILGDGVGVDVFEDVDVVGSSARGLGTFCKKLKTVFCTAFFFFFSKHCFVATETIFQFSLEVLVQFSHCFTHSNTPVMLIVLLIRSLI